MVATSQIAQTTLRSVLGQDELDELLSEREKINEILQEIIDEATAPWGIKVSIVEIKDVEIPSSDAARDGAPGRGRARAAREDHQRRGRVPGLGAAHGRGRRHVAGARSRCSCATCRRCSRSARRTDSTIVFPLPIDLLTALKNVADAAEA